MREALEPGFEPLPFSGEEALEAQLSATLGSRELGVAVAVLVKKYAPEDALVGLGSAGDPGSGSSGVGTFEARAHSAASRLEGFRVHFVRGLRSIFYRMSMSIGSDGSGGGHVFGRGRPEEDITAPNGASGSLFYVQEVSLAVGAG